MSRRPFRISPDWIDYAHGPGAEDGQPVATRLVGLPYNSACRKPLVSISDPLLVAEIVDVAELYFGDGDAEEVKARRVFRRGIEWLKAAGVTDWRAMHKAGMHEAEHGSAAPAPHLSPVDRGAADYLAGRHANPYHYEREEFRAWIVGYNAAKDTQS